MVGSRPMIFSRRSYSSGVRPCSATICGVIAGSLGSLTGGFFSTVTTAHDRASTRPSNSALPSVPPSSGSTAFSGCGIRPSTVLRLVEDAGDVADRAVGIAACRRPCRRRAVAEGDLAAILEPLQRVVVGEVVAVGMGDRDPDHLARLVAVGEQALAGLDLEVHVARRRTSAARCASARPAAGPASVSDLEAVADAQHRHALRRRGVLTSRHHRRLRRHGAAAQIVAVGEAARHARSGRSSRSRRRRARPSAACRPVTSSIACATSPSRLEPGKTRTAAFISPPARSSSSRSPCWRAACWHISSSAGLGLGLVGLGELELDELALAHVADLGEAQAVRANVRWPCPGGRARRS